MNWSQNSSFSDCQFPGQTVDRILWRLDVLKNSNLGAHLAERDCLVEMILTSVALEYQVIDQRIFVALITMALTTSMLSGPVMQRLVQKT